MKLQISKFPFYQWGDTHTEYPRFACPIVNDDGNFKDEEASCYPLDRWNFLLEFPQYKNCDWTTEHLTDWKEWWSRDINMDDIINERSFSTPTPALSISSLDPLTPLKKYLLRSCILKWDYLGHFKKHIDTWHPTKWIRLWGTTDPDRLVIRFEDEQKNMVEEKNIEEGRLYVIDTVKYHESLAFRDDVHHFFISVSLDALNILKELKIETS